MSKYSTKRFSFGVSKAVKADLFTWQKFFQEPMVNHFFLMRNGKIV